MVSDSVPGREVLTVFRTIAVFSFGIVFGTLMASHYHHLLEAPAKISYDLAQNMSKANENAAHIEQGDPNDNAAHIEQGDPNDDAAHIEQGDQNHNDAHIEQGDPNENAAHIEHEDPNDSAAHIEHGDPNCIKFVMFTTQRSGSGWLCEALSHQPEVWCPIMDEPMGNFSKRPEEIFRISANWMDEVDRSFDRVCKEARSQGKRIAGFKIMYNQVGGKRHKVDGVELPREWFKDYLQKRNVRILHLVREAVILSVASKLQTEEYRKKLHLSSAAHTNDPEVAAVTMKSSKISFGQEDLQKLRSKEHEVLGWLAFLRHLGLPYHYVRYEDLTSQNQDVFVHMMLLFLGIEEKVSYPKFHSEYYLSHQARCEDRIAHFADEVNQLIHGTMSARACAVLQYSALV